MIHNGASKMYHCLQLSANGQLPVKVALPAMSHAQVKAAGMPPTDFAAPSYCDKQLKQL
jgi:hypothetical protein